MGLEPVRSVLAKDFTARRYALRRELKLTTKPAETLAYFGEAVVAGVGGLECPRVGAAHVGAAVAVCALAFLQTQARRGAYGAAAAARAAAAEALAAYCSWWFVCGVLSTVGLGTGLQTGALFLFPHVAKLGADWRRRGAAALGGHRAERWFAAAARAGAGAGPREVPWLLAHAALPGFWSGAGSAVGELVPFVIARAMVRAGHDPFAILADDDDREAPRRRWTPAILVARTRRALEDQLRRGAAWKVFVLALIPNPLFDLCALVCGATAVPFPSFFLAVFAAKAVVRTPLQTCAVALAAARLADDAPAAATTRRLGAALAGKAPPTLAAAGRRAALAAARHGWAALLFLLSAAFVAATVEQVAQQRAVAGLQAQLDGRPVIAWAEGAY